MNEDLINIIALCNRRAVIPYWHKHHYKCIENPCFFRLHRPYYIYSILVDMLHHLLFLYTCESTTQRKNPGEVSKSHLSPS